jgi:hypothetical protein
MAPAGDSPLALDPETMRRLGDRTIDMLVDLVTGTAGPVVRAATPADLRARLATASELDVDRAVEQGATLSFDLVSAPVATPERYPPIDRGWLRRPSLGTAGLRSLPLFTSLDEEPPTESCLRRANTTLSPRAPRACSCSTGRSSTG